MHLSRGGKQVLIGGAYAGDHVIQVAKVLAETSGKVHAFEPDPEQFRVTLRHNVEINSLHNVAMHTLALWSDETARLRLVGFDALAHTEVVRGGEEGVATVTIDLYGKRRGVTKFDVIMLDLEGSEFEVLKGARSYLQAPAGSAPDIILQNTSQLCGLVEVVLRKYRDC